MASHRIVMIDDSVMDVFLFRKCLDSVAARYELVVLGDGNAASLFVEAERVGTERKPCVFVIDLHVPLTNDLEILKAIRNTPPIEHIKVMVTGSMPSQGCLQEIKDLGAAYSDKPSSLEDCQAFAKRVWDFCQSDCGAAAI